MFKNTEKQLENSLFELKDKLLPINLDDSLSLDSIKNSYYNPEIDETKFNNGNERLSKLSNDFTFIKDFSIDYDFESLINQVKERNISNSKRCIDFCPSKKKEEIQYYFVDDDLEIKKDNVVTTYYLKKKPYPQFTNPKDVNSHCKDKIKFLFKNKYGIFVNDFLIDESDDNNIKKNINTNEIIEDDNEEIKEVTFSNFINELNDKFILSSDESNISTTYAIKNYILVVLFIIILVLMISILYFLLQIKNSLYYFIGSIILLLLVIFLIFICKFIKNSKYLLLKERLIEREEYNKSLQDFLFKWNKIYFNSKNLNVECPLSLDYIIINLNYKEFEIWIQPHNF
jgi:flagellar biosynthesis protein FliQ